MDEKDNRAAATTAGDTPEMNRACREQYWNDLSIEGKIERTRQQVKSLCATVDTLRVIVHRLSALIQSHQHNLVGLVLVPPADPRQEEGLPQRVYLGRRGRNTEQEEYF